MGSYQSGQMGLTVTQIAYAYGGSNPSLPTIMNREAPAPPSIIKIYCGNSSVDRALAFQAGGRGFESRFPLLFRGSYESDYLFSFLRFRGF